MTGAPDAVYIQARRVLLDALEALGEHRSALVLVGAQAIYLHTGEGGLAVAPYTTDGDIAVDPEKLSSAPKLEDAMTAAGFVLSAQPGVWIGTGSVEIDLLVPESLGLSLVPEIGGLDIGLGERPDQQRPHVSATDLQSGPGPQATPPLFPGWPPAPPGAHPAEPCPLPKRAGSRHPHPLRYYPKYPQRVAAAQRSTDGGSQRQAWQS